ncbi:hypothetical protein HQ39_04085 [Porphyromonas sp. COT-108 OH2963]|nr:hypothetical protein HQ39_04085 [Porphyromonas sp. COT-108 OH2963]
MLPSTRRILAAIHDESSAFYPPLDGTTTWFTNIRKRDRCMITFCSQYPLLSSAAGQTFQ